MEVPQISFQPPEHVLVQKKSTCKTHGWKSFTGHCFVISWVSLRERQKRSKGETDGGKEKADNTDITRARNMPLRKAKTKRKKELLEYLMENSLEL